MSGYIYENKHGVAFVYGSYRISIEASKKKEAKSQIVDFCEEHGGLGLVSRLGENNYQAVASDEAGVALGEFVLSKIGREKANIIYCEDTGDEGDNQTLLVLIRNGLVALDTNVPPAKIPTELLAAVASLPSDEEGFEVILAGESPALSVEGDGIPVIGSICLEKAVVANIVRQAERIVADATEGDESVSIQAVAPQLKALGITNNHAQIAACAIGVIAGLFFYLGGNEEIREKFVYEDPYQDYRAHMGSVHSPVGEIIGAILALSLVENIDGWELSELRFSGGTFFAALMVKDGGVASTSDLLAWAESKGFKASFDKRNIVIAGVTDLTARRFPDTIYQVKDVIAAMRSEIEMLVGAEITVSGGVEHTSFAETEIVISTKNAILQDLVAMAIAMADTPTSIKVGSLKPANLGYDAEITAIVAGKNSGDLR